MKHRFSFAATCVAAVLVLFGAGPRCARAQAAPVQSAPAPAVDEGAQDPGVGADALPGARRVAFASALDPGIVAAGTLSYGYTDSVERVRAAHHRLLLEAAGSYGLTDAIAFGASLASHYDAHVGGGSDGDSSLLLSSRLAARVRSELDPGVSLGGELAVLFPGADSVGRGLAAITPELRVLGSFTGLHPELVLGVQLGARIDRSGEGIEKPERLASADRIAIGASDSSAVLVGVGATYSASASLHVLGELGWDVLVGPRAPGPLESPIRITGGVRYALTRLLALDAFLTLSPSGRPDVELTDPLVPIEPRVVLGAGLSARFAKLAARPSVLKGQVVDELGEPIAGARVVATDAAHARTLHAITDRDGAFSMTSTEGARLVLRAQADHRVPGQLEVVLAGRAFELGDWALPRGRGALVGRVLGPDGLPKAGVLIGAYTLPEGSAGAAPPIAEMTTADDGTFALRDLPAGPLQLSAGAQGFRDAQANVIVPVQRELSTDLMLAAALPEGQIRGTVRGAGGQALSATIRIDPLGIVLSAERDGTFSIDVVPGRYELLVTAAGYEPQQRVVDVERDGVTVLPIDLVRQP